jgi:hypothetical protein
MLSGGGLTCPLIPMKTIPRFLTLLAALATISFVTPAWADTTIDAFGSGGNAFTMNFVDIGNPGNANDDTGYGGVANTFRMSTYEVSRDMITKANAAGSLGISLSDLTSYGGNGVNRPATGVSWNEAARYVNWLNVSSGSAPAYKFSAQPGEAGYNVNATILLWSAGDAGYNAANPFRNSNATYFLPSENEWYKAAYYSGTGSTYYDYPTGSDTTPAGVASGTVGAVYAQSGPADITSAGGLSFYGTMGQGGNAWEWMETGSDGTNDSADSSRGLRGGSWGNWYPDLSSAYRNYGYDPSFDNFHFGFRVASVTWMSNVATLSGLVLSSGTLSPTFASATTSYAASVPNATTSMRVTPTVTDSTATIKVNGATVASGAASASIPLVVGTNTITILVTAQDGTTINTNTVTVTRSPSAVSTLSGLVLSSGTLSPTFASSTTTYTANVTNVTNSITVVPALTTVTASVTVNGTTVASGTASAFIPLVVGTNTITTVVTAQDGVTMKTYTVTVTRAPSAVSTLSGLVLSSGILSPSFASATITYTASVTNATPSMTVTPTVTDSTATIKVNGTTVTSGSASASIPLAVGPNTISVVVTAQDGTTTKTYTVDVGRTLTLTIGALSNGSITGVAIGGNYLTGTTATLTAVPAEGYAFTGWTGAASGTANPLFLVMNSNKTIGATFTRQYTLTASALSNGTISGIAVDGKYLIGTTATLTAVPAAGYVFIGWTGATSGTTNPLSLLMDADKTIGATYAVGIEVLVGGQLPAGSEVVRRGSLEVTMQTAFANGTILYTLDGSTPSLDSELYTGPLTLDRSCTVRAVAYSSDFSIEMQSPPLAVVIVSTLTTTTEGGGSVSVQPPDGSYASGSMATLTATPAAGWTFLQWFGDATGTNPVTSVQMTRNKYVQAVFGTAVNTTMVGSGSILQEPLAAFYPYGTRIRFSGLPASGNYLAFWGNAVTSTNNPLDFLVTTPNPTLTAVFQPLTTGQFALALAAEGGGKVVATPAANRHSSGASVLVTAQPDAGQDFVGWSGNAAGSVNPLTVAMNQSKTITAVFTKHPRLRVGTALEGLVEGGFRLTLIGEFGKQYEIFGSSDLVNWTQAGTLTNVYGTSQLTDGEATNQPRRFYRAAILNP